jgi:hypothetical protein
MIFVHKAMFDDPALIYTFLWTDMSYRDEAADKQMQAED